MELNFEPPVEGECIGRGISLRDKLVLIGLIVLICFSVWALILVGLRQTVFQYIVVSLGFGSVFLFVLRGAFIEIDASSRLVYSKNGFLLKHYKYRLLKMSTISLVGNKLYFIAEFDRKGLIGNPILHNKRMEFKIEKRFRDKPHLLVEFLNTHARNTTPLLEK